MSQCCEPANSQPSRPNKHRCPSNGKLYTSVASVTILHHLNEPWLWKEKQQGYYFCDDPDCEVVYFSQDGSTISKSALRTPVGIKENTEESLICYCFGVTKKTAARQQIKDFVVKQTRGKTCACSTRNPSGKCCLKDFPKT